MKPQKNIKKVLYVLSALCLLVFFSSSGFRDKTTTGGWYQQYLPTGITNNINCLEFTDSLTGYIATANNTSAVSYLLKTTNGGDNWFVLVRDTTGNIYSGLRFFNQDTALIQGYDQILKTTNAGLNWIVQCYLPGTALDGFYALNLDTIFTVDYNSIIGGLWRTTDGGTSWQMLVNFGSGNPEAVYFYNKNIGFIVRYGTDTYKTTDGGYNWFYIPSGGFSDIYFFDSLNGYLASGFNMKKTTDGGLNWVTQQLPNTFVSGIEKFCKVNFDTLWGIGGTIYNNGYRGIVYKTTNGGISWGYQVPLNNNNIPTYSFVAFINKLNGWAYHTTYGTGVHTITGGSDTTFFTGIKLVEEYAPTGYLLRQNYPNPFNPQTNIPFELSESGYVTLKVYDITGREVKELINGKWGKASYVAEFNAENLASGIYFYRLKFVSDATKKEFIDTKKMMLLK
jgi:photosystem II stability/assembly factor-like uncharacterized protein